MKNIQQWSFFVANGFYRGDNKAAEHQTELRQDLQVVGLHLDFSCFLRRAPKAWIFSAPQCCTEMEGYKSKDFESTWRSTCTELFAQPESRTRCFSAADYPQLCSNPTTRTRPFPRHQRSNVPSQKICSSVTFDNKCHPPLLCWLTAGPRPSAPAAALSILASHTCRWRSGLLVRGGKFLECPTRPTDSGSDKAAGDLVFFISLFGFWQLLHFHVYLFVCQCVRATRRQFLRRHVSTPTGSTHVFLLH